MASSSTEIANLALGHINASKEIGNLDTENSAEANACRRYYDIALDSLEEDFEYPFMTTRAALGLITEDPNDDYQYEYTYPSDCQRAGRIVTSLTMDDAQSSAKYVIRYGTSGRVIWTNCSDAILEYQLIVTDTGRFQPNFTLALSYKLAELIAPTLSGGDPFGLGPRAEANYEKYVSKAQSNALANEQEEEQVECEWIRAREGLTASKNEQDWVAFPIGITVT